MWEQSNLLFLLYLSRGTVEISQNNLTPFFRNMYHKNLVEPVPPSFVDDTLEEARYVGKSIFAIGII